MALRTAWWRTWGGKGRQFGIDAHIEDPTFVPSWAGDEFGHAFGDESHDLLPDAFWADRQRLLALENKRPGKRMTAKAVQRQCSGSEKSMPGNAWGTNRMLGSGVAQRRDHAHDWDDNDDETTTTSSRSNMAFVLHQRLYHGVEKATSLLWPLRNEIF
ncbi:hypothetical protein DV736_g1510, partial [Chaetothyriales sp. CBS 134916]